MTTRQERYQWYKSHGICVKCGQRDARKGLTLCIECAEKERVRSKKYREAKKEILADRYHMRALNNVCRRCGGELDEDGFVTCKKCRQRISELARKRRAKNRSNMSRSERPNYGLCYRCGKPVEHEGVDKLCPSCKRKNREHIDRINSNPSPAMIAQRERFRKVNTALFIQ